MNSIKNIGKNKLTELERMDRCFGSIEQKKIEAQQKRRSRKHLYFCFLKKDWFWFRCTYQILIHCATTKISLEL